MPQSTGRLIRACLLTAALTFAPVALAGIIEPTPIVLPPNAAYAVPDTCVSVVCLENTILEGFSITSDVLNGGNQVLMSTATLTANLFQNVLGAPGAFIGPVQLFGEADITYFNKPTFSEFGTFDTQIVTLDLSGSFTGPGGTHTLSAILNPSQPSLGQATVEPLGTVPQTFELSSFFDVFTELSIDGGPYVPGPERVVLLTTTPEPASYGAISLVLALLAVVRFAGARRHAIRGAGVTVS